MQDPSVSPERPRCNAVQSLGNAESSPVIRVYCPLGYRGGRFPMAYNQREVGRTLQARAGEFVERV